MPVQKSMIAQLRELSETTVYGGGNQPLMLTDPNLVYMVIDGRADLFLVELQSRKAVGVRRYMRRVNPGSVLFGLETFQTGMLAIGRPETQFIELTRENFEIFAKSPEFLTTSSGMIDEWVEASAPLFSRSLPPTDFTLLHVGHETNLEAKQIARAGRRVLWVEQMSGVSRFCDRADVPPINKNQVMPLSGQTWLEALEPSSYFANVTIALVQSSEIWGHLNRFNKLLATCLEVTYRSLNTEERRRLESRVEKDQQRVNAAYGELASLLNEEASSVAPINAEDALFAACQALGESLGLPIVTPPGDRSSRIAPTPSELLRQIAAASRVRTRQVVMRDGWWKSDVGPLLGFLVEGRAPVALLQPAPNRYEIYNPLTGKRSPVTRTTAYTVEPIAYTFYRPFPTKVLTAWNLIQFGIFRTRRDLTTILLAGLGAGFLSMIPPIMIGIIFDTVITNGQRGLLVQVAGLLLVTALVSAVFQLTQGFAVMRLESKMDSSLQAAVFDRLLDLPATFFREYASGDLGVRAMGISTIRQTLSRVAIASVLSLVMGLFNFALLFFYNIPLALLALLLTVVALTVIVTLGLRQIAFERELSAQQGKIAGMMLEFINGIAKFRVSGAEGRAFAEWAKAFARQRRLAFKSRSVGNLLYTFNSAFPLITFMAIFGVFAAASSDHSLPVGSFLAFTAAFTTFLNSVLNLGTAVMTALNTVPTYERAKTIVETLPEVDEAKKEPGKLDGEIELSNVSFRYGENGPTILQEISIHVMPGQFVALVGPSGSGKSTIFRLLLGFEKPVSGSVLYSGFDLSELNVRSVRRQIGVVLQNGKLMSGDISSNILGASSLKLEDAWEAARMAGFDDDVKQMPMGMQTIVSEGGGTLSGGQRQRLMIARAIVNKPRILLFDEATSALDNRTQEIVSRSLEGLDATRIVIAHRLSTIQNADYIYVVDRGHVVQHGTYNDLLNQEGVFRELTQRQMA
jgi:NHLM bacteriocin system ABC transporter ATP-binding protein